MIGTLARRRRASVPGQYRRPVLTTLVCLVTLAVSLAAQFSPTLMHLFTRDLTQLRAGQWWRSFTPVFVQPDGWGQLAFNLVGLAVVGIAVEQRVSRPCWALVFLLGGPGSIAVLSVWKPGDTGGGSSDAVAALLGAFMVWLVLDGRRLGWEWPAEAYAAFFAGYLTTLDIAGVVPSIIVGNASLIVMVNARRGLRPTVLSTACLVVVLVGGVVMTIERDGHGAGILTGAVVASLVLIRLWLLERAGTSRQLVQLAVAIVTVWALSLLAWVACVRLLGVTLIVTSAGHSRVDVGWASVSVTAVVACVVASIALRMLQRRWPERGRELWTGLCAAVAVASLAGPLVLAVGATSRVALMCLHLTCAAAIIAALAPSRMIRLVARTDEHPVIPPTTNLHLIALAPRQRKP